MRLGIFFTYKRQMHPMPAPRESPLVGIFDRRGCTDRGNEIVLFSIGVVFVIEILSVVLQIGCFKYTSGGLFRCAPIDHHFHLAGWSEPQVVVRFWLLAVAFAILALATLKLR